MVVVKGNSMACGSAACGFAGHIARIAKAQAAVSEKSEDSEPLPILLAGAPVASPYDVDRLDFREVNMFRLLKLAAYALLGYVLYELFLGISEGEPGRALSGGGGQRQRGGQRQGGGQQSGGGAGGSDQGVTMSGPGEGRTIPVTDIGGAERNERVGRGVVTG
ncbi:MAG TPA: hypothetical protein VLI90_20940 [Tepidisphaeraceae bacterium]|nr:hypothetical protein [Tepidisphaeraceae bacterium]